RGEVQEVARALVAIGRARNRLTELRAASGGARLEDLADGFRIDFQEACLRTCVLASVCKERHRDQAGALGDAAAEIFGSEMEIDRLLELAAGGEPRDERERELSEQLQDAAELLELPLRVGRER